MVENHDIERSIMAEIPRYTRNDKGNIPRLTFLIFPLY